MTEHGVAPEEAGAKDEATAWRLKMLCAVRSFCLWLNQGVDVMHDFSAYEDRAMGMGLLPPNLKDLAPDAEFDQVATPPLKALRNLTRAFETSAPPREVRFLRADVTRLGETGKVFDGKAPLGHPDVFAFLPFQVSDTRHIVAVYVATYDALRPMPEERYRKTVRGFSEVPRSARLYDPVAERSLKAELTPRGPAVEVVVRVTDCPRLLIFEE